MRIALAALMALHGIAHIVGFVGSWGHLKDAPRKTTILADRIDLGTAGIRVYGVLWLFLAIGFLYAALAAATAQHAWTHWTLWVAFASLIMSILSWPEARIGILVNLVILAWLHLGIWQGWF